MSLSFILFTLVACRPAVEVRRTTWEGPRVIVLVLDGVRDEESFGDGTSQVTGGPPETLMPESWEQLVPQGVRATGVLNVGITTTGPAHATLIGGTRQPLGNYDVLEDAGLYRPDLPTIFEEARKQLGLARAQTALAGNVSLIQPMAHSSSPMGGYDFGAYFRLVGSQPEDTEPERGGLDDRVVFTVLRTVIERRNPVLTVANLHEVDRATHGAGPDTYQDHLAILDSELPVFWQWVQAQPRFQDNTWLFVVSDHGRHDQANSVPIWQSHGDSCMGCRGIPWLVLGPGVNPGEVVDDTLLLEDIAPTVATILGFDLPWAEGMSATSLIDQAPDHTRSGVMAFDADGAALVEVRFTDDLDHRAEVVLEGQVLSDPDALHAGGVGVLHDEVGTWTCHRDLLMDVEAGRLPWEAWCGLQEAPGEPVVDLGLPWTEVAPYWEPVLASDGDGGMVLLTLHNPEGSTVPGQDADEGIRAMHHRDGVWTLFDARLLVSFPTGLSAAMDGDVLALAFAAGDPGRESRDTRRLYTTRLDLETRAFEPIVRLELGPEGASDFRAEWPALALAGNGDLYLAGIGHTTGVTHLLRAVSYDGGQTWTTLPEPILSGRVLPHVVPVQDGDETIFAAWDPDRNEALVCVATNAAEAQCQDAGSPRLKQLALSDLGIEALIDRGVGEWVVVTLPR